MFHYLKNTTLSPATANLPMLERCLLAAECYQPANPEHAASEIGLSRHVIKRNRTFTTLCPYVKLVFHDHEDIDVTRAQLRSHKRAKDNKSANMFRMTSNGVDSFQALHEHGSVSVRHPESCTDFVDYGRVYSRRQVAIS